MGSRYRQWAPAVAPRRQVACVWVRESDAGAAHRQLIVPDGCLDLLWDGAQVQVVGPDRVPRTVPVPGGTRMAGLRLRPGAAALLLGRTPARELCDLQVPLAELAPGTAELLTERLGTAGTATAAAELLDAFAAELRPGRPPDPLVEQAVAALGRPRPAPLPRLAEHLGLSERQLRRRLTDAVGYGPSTLHGVLRFQRALAAARRDGRPLAEAAAAAGYADQAHFTREVRRLAGVPPTTLLGRRPERGIG
ncbi:helix-turn-helix domain-containing protein [Kitasatospora sp. NPDC049285]|uniref:helix-turn-helix domain-containing protein n=1 Tax=Kitasatospora sp. NPDC049285 TaxID=3157096 RepID=UPI0034422161